MPPHGTRRLCVCINAEPLRSHIGQPVRDAKEGAHQVETQGSDAEIGPPICDHMGVESHNGSILLHACFEIEDGGVPLTVCKKHLLLADHDLNRPTRFLREKGSAKVHIKHLIFTAEAASDIRLDNTNSI